MSETQTIAPSLPGTRVVVCGRRPAQAHHVRFAQPRAMAMKVSDEFTVPLCVGHHDALHRVGDERAWWAARADRSPRRRLAAVDRARQERRVPGPCRPTCLAAPVRKTVTQRGRRLLLTAA